MKRKPSSIGDKTTVLIGRITKRMLDIERIIDTYNKATSYGQSPNGKEKMIEALKRELETYKLLKNNLK